MSSIGFQVDWLNERFKYDNAARNPKVEKVFLDYFRSAEKLNIIDIGSGTAANCLYFMERLFKHQTWTLIEQDAALCEAAKERIIRFLEDYNFYYNYADNTFRIKAWEYRIKIRIVKGSFYNLENLVDLSEQDVCLAAAVFDVLTPKQFQKFITPIFNHQIPLLTTMNYQRMRMTPEVFGDRDVIAAYERHMIREQVEGKALGPNCSDYLKEFFREKGLDVHWGKSQWNIDEQANRMHGFLLSYIENAIGGETNIVDWIESKRILSQTNQLRIEVDHTDFFIHQPK